MRIAAHGLAWGLAGLMAWAGAAWSSGLDSGKLAALDLAVSNGLARGNLPGGVLWLEHNGEIYRKAYGQRSVEPSVEPMTLDTVFDAASLTKVIATTPSVMRLVERGQLGIDEPVRKYLPDFQGEGSQAITVRHLLTHTSGLRPGLSPNPPWSGYETAIELACRETPRQPPGTAFRYSDINFILLGEMVRRVSGRPLNEFAEREIFRPLGMGDTRFVPVAEWRDRMAPTERTLEGVLRGVVHDPTSRRMGGVAGHAGLFTSASDLARFARMMLNEGTLDGVRVFRAETVRLMTSVQSPAELPARGLGWDIDSPYAGPRGELFPKGSYGHTGWTGTSLWIDPFSRTFLIFLSNRNHPTEEGTVVGLRKELGTLAAQAITDYDFENRRPLAATEGPAEGLPRLELPVEPIVLNGIDVLARDGFRGLRKKRVGLITNHTGVDRRRRPTVDLLFEAPEVELKCLFAPEHGLRGVLDQAVPDGVDERTGLPVHSLYGERRSPTPEQMAGLDILVFDVQDIGCRFYTYIATMGLCMEAAARAGVAFMVLDRVNPINGRSVEGPVYKGESRFVAYHPLPVRHGMTVGELAGMYRAEKKLDLDLTVVPLEGWKRSMWFDETGLPWINPSPNMRNLKEATLYPGIGLLEMALSVGRGTDTPFEVLGAPYLDDLFLADRLNALDLPGVRFVPVCFEPESSVFAGQECGGVYLLLTDREACPVVSVGLAVAGVISRHFGSDFDFARFNVLLLDESVVAAVRAGASRAELEALWAVDLEAYRGRRAAHLIYP